MIKKQYIAITLLSAIYLAGIISIFTIPQPTPHEYHMAYNEFWYSEVVKGNINDTVLPPGYVSLAIFNISPVIQLRLISLISLIVLSIIVYYNFGYRHTILLLSTPYILLWATRAHLDMLMSLLAVGGLILSTNLKHNFIGGLLIGLSTFVKPVAPWLLGLKFNWKYWTGGIFGLIPFVWWLKDNLASLTFHESSSQPFGNWARLTIAILVALSINITLILKSNIKQYSYLFAMIGFVLFAFIKAPIAHEYYLLPALILSVLLANCSDKKFWFYVIINTIISGGLYVISNLVQT